MFFQYGETDEPIDEQPTFQWVNLKGYAKCRNSAQGKKIIADDRGMCGLNKWAMSYSVTAINRSVSHHINHSST